MTDTTLIAIAISELVALLLIWRLWHSDDSPFFKVTFSLITVIPFIGPIIVFWLNNMPSPLSPALRDRYAKSTDVLDRWREVLDEKNPRVKYRKWQGVITAPEDETDQTK